jgi:hypothetical protein
MLHNLQRAYHRADLLQQPKHIRDLVAFAETHHTSAAFVAHVLKKSALHVRSPSRTAQRLGASRNMKYRVGRDEFLGKLAAALMNSKKRRMTSLLVSAVIVLSTLSLSPRLAITGVPQVRQVSGMIAVAICRKG